MEDEDIKCKECPSARHGFDRNASHNAGRYVCECESFVCPSEQLRQRVQELEELLKESYKDADEVLRPRVAELESLLKEAYADADSKRLDWMSARVHFYSVRRKDEFMEIVLDLSEYLPTIDFDLRKEIDIVMSNADIAAKALAATERSE